MAYCPQCRSEFRPGFTVCVTCGNVPLVDELSEIIELGPDSVHDAVPVGLITDTDLGRVVEIEGMTIDLLRVFPLKAAQEMQVSLSAADISSLIVPVPVTFPDMMPRFELRVLADQHAVAEENLRRQWADSVKAEGFTASTATPADVEECPACGASVPLDVDTCPECELFVGKAGDDELQ